MEVPAASAVQCSAVQCSAGSAQPASLRHCSDRSCCATPQPAATRSGPWSTRPSDCWPDAPARAAARAARPPEGVHEGASEQAPQPGLVSAAGVEVGGRVAAVDRLGGDVEVARHHHVAALLHELAHAQLQRLRAGRRRAPGVVALPAQRSQARLARARAGGGATGGANSAPAPVATYHHHRAPRRTASCTGRAQLPRRGLSQ
jgi:hypothetical protein